MSPSDTHNRYVTFGTLFPDGLVAWMPELDPASLPVWFPNPDDFFPKDVEPTYAIRNTATVATPVRLSDGGAVSIPAHGWWLYLWGRYQYVEDAYFFGGIPDDSKGMRYPSQALPNYPVDPPQWVIDGTPPPSPSPIDPGTGPDWQQQPDPGGSGMTPGAATTKAAVQAADTPIDGSSDTAPAPDTTTTPPEVSA